ncbi:MAG: hypothetical protein EPO37_00985 [Nitrosarchaeum sp.]|nr:MAG: hypothetical protein EPO37_00985 [Nitrosarchaeum sp.]
MLGIVSYPSINFGDEIESDLNSNYLISAFAEEDDESEDESEDNDSNELQTSEKIIKHENQAQENAEETILQFQ